ncbi:4-hydroxybutyrate coenzyme A transferase [Cryptotermes secundus]|nr:4-hydroxybutyrate coenzyme A transferase [Cryptotermes secundus]
MASVARVSTRLGGVLYWGPASVTVSRGNTPRTYYTYSPEPAQPLKRDPKWVSAKEAVQCIKSGDTVFIQGAAATPLELVKEMTNYGKTAGLKDVTVCHMHTEGVAGYTEPEFEGTAALYSIDTNREQVSPPDQHGFCSLGTSVDCVRAALMYSKTIVAQVNPQMPRTFGDGTVHQSHFDYAVKIDRPLPEHGGRPPTEIETKIGKQIAENLVEDGATLQMGIGNIPDAVLAELTNHKDLGIHSEMFAGGIVDLVNKGCITNNRKTINKGKIIGSFLIGTRDLYDFVDNNPYVEMRDVAYVNNTGIIAQNPKMTAINSCIEVDLTGQVVSDSIGTRMYSGFGGQVDFIRGAAEALDGEGKPIIALPSVTNKGESKISPLIKHGAGVVTTRAHVHYVVTEHGVAYLFGKTLRQRAHALINIAHPDHRESLEKAAFERLKCMPAP